MQSNQSKGVVARLTLMLGLLLVTSTHAFLPKQRALFRLGLFLQATPSAMFPNNKPPYLAVITEPDACDSEERLAETLAVLQRATFQHDGVDLISVRVSSDAQHERVVKMVQELVQICNSTTIVVSSDWVEAALEGRAHGIHVKESHRPRIPEIQQQFCQAGLAPPIIGTSAHSLESAVEALPYKPDYFFVGTCYQTQTHPEKTAADLEGPSLPGQIAQTVKDCPVLAIGGIDASNCAEPVELGATGVATIRAVLQAKDPAETVATMGTSMALAFDKTTTSK